MACERISASEWPSKPNWEGITTPPRISGRPATMRWTSQPWPIRKSRSNLGRHFFRQEQTRQVHVGWLGDLQIAVAARNHADLYLIQAFHQTGFIGACEPVLARFGERALEQVEAKYLRRLRQNQALARNSLADLVAMHLLHRVHGHNADNSGAVFLGFGEYFVQNAMLNKRPHGVVHRHQLGARAERRQSVLHGLLPAIAAFHQAHRLAELFHAQQLAHPLHVLGPQRHYDLRHRVRRSELPDGVEQDGRPFQQHELLPAGARLFGDGSPHACSQPGGWENNCDFHAMYLLACSGADAPVRAGPLVRLNHFMKNGRRRGRRLRSRGTAPPRECPMNLQIPQPSWMPPHRSPELPPRAARGPAPAALAELVGGARCGSGSCREQRAYGRQSGQRSFYRRWFAERWSRKYRWYGRSFSWRCPPPPSFRRPDTPLPGCTPCLLSG